MVDSRIKVLADQLVNYSCSLNPGERVLIEAFGLELPLIVELIKQVYAAGANPFVSLKNRTVDRALLMQANEDQIKMMADFEAQRMSMMDAYIGIRSGDNVAELSDVPGTQMEKYQTLLFRPVHQEIRVAQTKWVVLRYPSPSMAQQANTSTEAFEDFYFNVCNLDYGKMSLAMDPLIELMNQTSRVRIVAPGTNLSFSIEGMPAIKCSGKRNIPDGEVFTAPIKDSVEGFITYNTPSIYQGRIFENIYLEFLQGKIIKAESNDTPKLNQILNTDEGARFIGEFALGLNPYILQPMKDTLFDEKISGSLHFTPGDSYDECSNGNNSAIHWDLVLIQRPEYGGGEIYFDERLIRKDGVFVAPELYSLNPENLK